MLARWSGWGAIPQVFDETNDRFSAQRAELRRLLGTEAAWAQARRTTLNAHYTSATVVQAMWGATRALGVEGGIRVLEPGCGSGNFLGFAPPGAELIGVELDATTAEIAKHLYGSRAVIHNSGFEELRTPDGSVDLVIGNVPFAKVTPHDPRHNRGRHALHNYFLLKSLHLTRPGGLVVALTSRYTLDARNSAARKEMASLADLVGAVRLPERSFARSSGTDVVVDLVVMRRRLAGAEPTGSAWERVEPVDMPGRENAPSDPMEVNEYFVTHPERVVGRLDVTRGMYREHELTVIPTGELGEQLPVALERLVADARRSGLTFVPGSRSNHPHENSPPPLAAGAFELTHAQDGSFVVDGKGQVARITDGSPTAYQPRFAKDRPELARLIEVRDAARSVLAVQLDGGSEDELSTAQATLGARYRSYVRVYGTINRSTQARTGRRDPETGADIHRRVRPRMGGFREDPDWTLVAALEVFDEDTQEARPAAIFHDRIIDPPHKRHGVEAPDEAVAVCLDETGMVTLDRVAALLGIDPDTARVRLRELVYDEPGTDRLVPAAEYLSGNVREKLNACRAAKDASQYRANVAALQRVLPRQLDPNEVTARLGSPWIPSHDVETFCREVLDATVDVEHLHQLGQWSARLRDGSRRSVALTSEWGTARADAVTLLDASLNQVGS